MTAFATVLLPQPDSPARPTTSLGRIARSMPSTARTLRSPTPYSTARPRSSRSASLGRVVAGASAMGSTTLTTLRALLRTKADLTKKMTGSADGPQPGVAHLVDAGEDQGQAEHGDPDGEAREDERPSLALEHARVDGRPVERDAPARRRHVAEA